MSADPTEEIRRRIASLPTTSETIAERAAPEISAVALAFYNGRAAANGSAFLAGRRGVPSLYRSGALRDAVTTYKPVGAKLRASVASVPYARYQIRRGLFPQSQSEAFKAVLDRMAQDEISNRLEGS